VLADRRRGFAAIVFALSMATLLAMWAATQRVATSSTRSRLLAATARQTALYAAIAVAEQGPALFTVAVAGGDTPAREPDDRSLAARVRSLGPDDVLEVEDLPLVIDPEVLGEGAEIRTTRLKAFLTDVGEASRAAGAGCPCAAGRAVARAARGLPPAPPPPTRPPEVDCDKYREYREKIAPLAEGDPMRQAYEVVYLEGYRPVRWTGMLEIEVEAAGALQGAKAGARVRLRYPFTMESSPCPDVSAEFEALGYSSTVRLVPVEVGRFVETWSGDTP
jgi:hypothetical protein